MQIVVAYMAFTPYDMSQTSVQILIEKAWFGKGNYVPFKMSPGDALKAALESEHNANVKAMAVTQVTHWHVLRLRVAPADLANVFLEGKIHWSSNLQGLEWWGDFDTAHMTASNCVDWVATTLEPTGLRFPALFGPTTHAPP